jgi:hypothetical protein
MSTAYLVQYGRPGFVGRFRSDFPDPLARGTAVVVRGPRGLELGTVLVEPADRVTSLPDDGDLLRTATPDDERTAADLTARGRELLDAAQARADELGLPVSLVDAELALDGTSAVLHGLPWGACDASGLFAELSDRFGLPVRLLDLARAPVTKDAPEPAAGCGKPDCGSGSGGCSSCGTGGGCSTGSCSRGSVKSAAELTAYFADLRRKMEEHAATRTPLV